MSRHDFTFCGTESAAVYVLSEEGDSLDLAEAVDGTEAAYALPAVVQLAGRSPVADTFRTGRPLWLGPEELARFAADGSRPVRDTALRDHLKTWPPGAALGVLPLGGHANRLGCLAVMGGLPGGFDSDRRHLLELYADQVTAGVEAVVSPLVRRPRGTGEKVRGLVPLRSGALTLATAAGEMTADARVLELLGLSAGGFDGRVETLLACAVPDDVPALMSVVEPGRSSPADHQLTFRIRRSNGELRWLGLRCRTLLAPDGTPERVLGVMADASSLRPGADEVSMVRRLSARLAGASTVREVGEVTVGALRGPLGADRIAVAELTADRLVVTVLDPPQRDAWPEVWRSEWRSEWPDAPSGALPTLRGALREGTVAIWLPGSDLEPGLAGIGPGGLAVLPLQAEGRTVGAALVGWDRERAFGQEERSLLTATASLVGQALMRAHALDARHELARTLQRSLLPRKLPVLAGGKAVARYLPATAGLEVGGDWYDVIPLPDSHVALVIGDVQGHSAEAATIMGQMRTAIRAYAVEGHPPDVVVSHANRLLMGMETDLFATCCYVDLDMEEGMARTVRAGHPPPLLRHPDGSTEELCVQGGPPLGVTTDAQYPMTEFGLAPGSLLTLLTDGLVESARLPLEEGMKRLRALLGAADPADTGGTADALLGHPERRDDDVAVLLLRYDGVATRPVRERWTVWRLPDAIVHARRFTARTLRSWEAAGDVDIALLIVSELVTNAIAHTEGRVRLDLTLIQDRLRIAVNDSSPRSPGRPPSVDPDATGGRGLLIVEALSSAWGWVPFAGGKQVWAEVSLTR